MAEAVRRSRSIRSTRSSRSSARRKASRIWRSRISSRAASRSCPSRATTRIRAARCSPSGEPYRYALRPRTDFLVDLDEIPRRDAAARRRILYLNYPNNPTAAIAPRDYLERVVARCRELDILLVYDNAYSELAFDGYVPPSIFEIDGARDVAIEFHSLSKTYNMTGWRCGWAVAAPEIASVLTKVKSFTDTGQFMAVQAAGVAALESYDEFVPGNVATFKARRDAAVDAFRAARLRVRRRRARRCISGSRCPKACRARCSPTGCSRKKASS